MQRKYCSVHKRWYYITVWDNKPLTLFHFCPPPPPDLPLIFLVFELRKWSVHQKCSKMFKVFEFFGFESKFSFCKALRAKMTIDLKKKFQINAIFDHFWVKFLVCSEHHKYLFCCFLYSLDSGEHFSYPHGASSTPRSKAMRAWKMKILRKKFFFKFKKKNFFSQNFHFSSSHSFASRCARSTMRVWKMFSTIQKM